ncbi:MAG TPA: PAS domain-containing protein [Rhizomicrobium sp.]|nr:PAS domain-containing protein [Rhizomicrobium sp.]
MQALGLVWRGVDAAAPDTREIRSETSEPAHFGARLLFDHWGRRRAEGGFVVHRDVPSRALAPILRNLVVYQPMGGGRDFRVRLAGSGLIRRFDCDITGLKLSELFDREGFDFHCTRLREVVSNDAPAILDIRLPAARDAGLHYEMVSLPVRAPETATTWVLGGFFYHDWAR